MAWASKRGRRDEAEALSSKHGRRNGNEIWEKVRADESYWNLGVFEGKPCVSIYLEKERESWWKSAIAGDKEIDTQQVQVSVRCK